MKSILVPALRPAVYAAFATEKGAQTFLARSVRIELRPGGPYEIYFKADAERGLRGSEGSEVLSFIPDRMLSFTWNAPPEFGRLRGERTFVVISLADESGKTRLHLHHLGWQSGADWTKLRAYFDAAWDLVLKNLVRRFESGPLFEPMEETEKQPLQYFYYVIRPVRPDAFTKPTPAATQAMGRHASYMRDLMARGFFVIGGPSRAARGGGDTPDSALVILRAESAEQAEALMSADPAVRAGVIQGELKSFLACVRR